MLADSIDLCDLDLDVDYLTGTWLADDDTQEIAITPLTATPQFEPYPRGWLTLTEWDAIDALATLPGAEVEGASVWIPAGLLEAATHNLVGLAWTFAETVFQAGGWITLGAVS